MTTKLTEYIDYELDSLDEEWFAEFIIELSIQGLVVIQSTVDSYKIFDGFSFMSKPRPKHYTPDFVFKFKCNDLRESMSKYLLESPDGLVYVDVKGNYTKRLTSSITFPDRQAMMWDKHSVYVNKVIPEKLFQKTFVPNSLVKSHVYLRDSKHGVKGQSKFKFKTINYVDFIESFRARRDGLNNRRKRSSSHSCK